VLQLRALHRATAVPVVGHEGRLPADQGLPELLELIEAHAVGPVPLRRHRQGHYTTQHTSTQPPEALCFLASCLLKDTSSMPTISLQVSMLKAVKEEHIHTHNTLCYSQTMSLICGHIKSDLSINTNYLVFTWYIIFNTVDHN